MSTAKGFKSAFSSRFAMATAGKANTNMEIAADKKLQKYIAMTEKALTLVRIAAADKNSREYKSAADFLQMAKNYLSDSRHFAKKGDVLTAIAAASYAHAWLDAGARLGLFKVDNNSDLFTVD